LNEYYFIIIIEYYFLKIDHPSLLLQNISLDRSINLNLQIEIDNLARTNGIGDNPIRYVFKG